MLIYRLAVRILIDLIVVLCICVLTCAASSATPHCCSYYKEMAGHREAVIKNKCVSKKLHCHTVTVDSQLF